MRELLPVESYECCLVGMVEQGDDDLTRWDIRKRCKHLKPKYFEWEVMSENGEYSERLEYEHGVITNRILSEKAVSDDRFVIIHHKPNYLLPFSYNTSPNKAPFVSSGDNMSRTEVKFQISLKAPLWQGVFKGYGNLYVAYTNISWWQACNHFSSPFRETNHEPEIFMAFPTDFNFFGMRLRGVTTGLKHQSNGRSGSLSRSWNRVMFGAFFERKDFYVSVQPWYRIPEKTKDDTNPDWPDVEGDDNPDIERFMGYGEMHIGYKLNKHHLNVMLRNNLRSDNVGAVQLDWSFPLTKRFRGYVQYFYGYGESLIDYIHSFNRISFGMMLTDWL